jgi:hypothetical protein
MAAGLMFGLAFATILCLIVTPVMYAIFYRVPVPADGSQSVEPSANFNAGKASSAQEK